MILELLNYKKGVPTGYDFHRMRGESASCFKTILLMSDLEAFSEPFRKKKLVIALTNSFAVSCATYCGAVAMGQ
jgi:hypothetical protein